MTDTRETCISFYLDLGFTLTPLNGKIPLVKKWQKAEYDPLFDTDGNYGVVLQDDDLVVDIDPRNGGTIPAFLQNVATLTVKTGGGGWHYYFKKPAAIAIVGLLKAYPGVEFKTKGQQVVGAGSKTTGEYVITNNSPIIDCPFIDLIKRTSERLVQKTDKKVAWTDDLQTQERFIKYLSNCPVATQGQNGDNTTFQVACQARDLALDEQTCVKLMMMYYNPRCLPPWPMEEISVKVNNAYKYAQNDAGTLNPLADFDEIAKSAGIDIKWDMAKDGIHPKSTYRNVHNVLSMPNTPVTDLLKYNEFSGCIEFTTAAPWHKSKDDAKNWQDEDTLMLKEWISKNYSFDPDVKYIKEALLPIARKKTHHPIKDYLRSIKWDGTPRIRTWLTDYLGIKKDAYTMAIGEKMLCAAVARVFRPGIKFDYITVFEGVQGQGKSRVCKALGGEHHIGLSFDPKNKDFVTYITGKWIIEIEEMDFATRAESQAIKAFLSRDIDRIRVAYGSGPRDFYRQSIFIGTYNPLDGESTYLKDPTGNRRFWPVTIEKEKIDVSRLIADRDQLWAEATAKAKECQLYLEDPNAERILQWDQKMRQEHDPWHEMIAEYVENATIPGQKVMPITIYQMCLGGKAENFSVFFSRRISNILRQLGWKRAPVWNKEKKRGEQGWEHPFENKEQIKVLTDSNYCDIF